MEFISKVYGKIEYNPSNLITFKDGIPGFEHLNKFILVDLKEYEPFKLLQSMENDKIGLILISPFEVMDDYEVELTDELLKELNIKKPEEVLILNTVTIEQMGYSIFSFFRLYQIYKSELHFYFRRCINILYYAI